MFICVGIDDTYRRERIPSLEKDIWGGDGKIPSRCAGGDAKLLTRKKSRCEAAPRRPD